MVKREAAITEQSPHPRSAVALSCVSVTQRSLRANLVTAALPAPGSDGSESVLTLATGPAHVLLLTLTLPSPGVALCSLAAVLVTLTGLAISVTRVTVVARQASVTVPAPSVPQTRQALSEH